MVNCNLITSFCILLYSCNETVVVNSHDTVTTEQ